MKDAIDQMTDAELSQAVAVECAGFKDDPHFPEAFWLAPDGQAHHKSSEHGHSFDIFATSADAVLPLMHARGWADFRIWGNYYCARLLCNGQHVEATARTFARAACLVLLMAKRAEKGAATT